METMILIDFGDPLKKNYSKRGSMDDGHVPDGSFGDNHTFSMAFRNLNWRHLPYKGPILRVM